MKKLISAILFLGVSGFGMLYSQGIYQLWGTATKGGFSNYGTLFSTDQYGNKFTVHKSFTSDYTGAKPQASKLVDYNGKLYGVTTEGGTFNLGVVFRYDPITNLYEHIHSFSGSDGSKPFKGLTVFGNKLYGMTLSGGITGAGTLYEIDPITKVFTKKIDLNNATTGGAPLYGGLTEYNGKLYGTLRAGGTNNVGVIFSYTPASNSFQALYSLPTNSAGAGLGISGDLCLFNNVFYGTSAAGGANKKGSLFIFDPANNTFTTIHSFTDGSAFGGMVVLNNKLYGSNTQILYEINPATNTYTALFNFTYSSPGSLELMIYDNKLWGVVGSLGANNNGLLFTYDPAANTYTKKADFSSATTGSNPNGVLTLFNSKLYCLTTYGGNVDLDDIDFGVLAEFDPVTNTLTKEFSFNDNSKEGSSPNGGVVLLGTKLYGMTLWGGTLGGGAIYEYDLLTNTFSQSNSFGTEGYNAYGRMMFFNNKFWGLTSQGGYPPNADGTIFEFDTLTKSKTVKFNFFNAGGGTPTGNLSLFNNKFYGLTQFYGASPVSRGTVFEYDPVTNSYTSRSDLICSTTGCSPRPGNSFTEFNGKLYALIAQGGGSSGSIGIISEYDPATLQFTLKMPLGSLGSFPSGAFTKVNNKLYGNVPDGIIEYDPITNTAIKKYTHTNSTGVFAMSDLTAVGNRLYGTAKEGGTNDLGTFYEYNLTSNTFTKKLDFNGVNGANPIYCKLELVPAVVSPGTPGTCLNLNSIVINSSNNNEWVAFTDDKGEAIAEINANGNNLGQVTISLYVHNGAIRSDGNNNKFLNRNISISSANLPGSPIGIRLYIRQSEAEALIAAPGSGAPLINDIRLFKNSNTCQSAIPAIVDSIVSINEPWIGGYVYTSSVSSNSTFYFTSRNYTAPACPVIITNNTISSSATTVCGNVNSTAITGSTPTGGNGTFQYEWLNSTDNINYTPVPGVNSKEYTVLNINRSTYFKRKVTSGNCTNLSSTVLINFSTIPSTPIITANNPTIFCQGGSVTLTSNAASGNQWYKDGIAISGSTGTTLNVTTSGSYTVKVTINGCESPVSNTTVVTVNPTPATPSITLNGTLLISSAATGNQWYVNNVLIPGSINQNHTPANSGDYKVQVIANNCPSAFSNTINFIVTDVQDLSLFSNQIKIYPNPVNDKLIIKRNLNSISSMNIKLFDMNGKELKVITSNSLQTEIDMSQLSPGTYILWIEDKENKITGRKMITKQ